MTSIVLRFLLPNLVAIALLGATGCDSSSGFSDNSVGSGGLAGMAGALWIESSGGATGNTTGAGGDTGSGGAIGNTTASRVPTDQERLSAKQDIEAFLETRSQANPPAATELAARLTEQGFTASDVESLIRSGPLSLPTHEAGTDGAPGTRSLKDISCFQAKYSSRYWLYVPDSYAPTHPTPLVVIAHGGNSAMSTDYAESTAQRYLDSYRELADGELGAVLVAPATTVGWGVLGDVLVESVISQTIREYNIDPDRIFVTGQSMGGHMTWRSAMNHGDRFAAFSPQSGGYATYIDDHLIENVFGTVGYVTYGTTEPYELNTTNDLLGQWLTERNYPWTIVKKSGGHEIYADEIPKIGALFATHSRDLYPPRTYLHAVGELRYPNSTTPVGEAVEGRSMRWNFRNWIELDSRSELVDGAVFYGENRGDGLLELQTNGVRNLRLLLHPKMVDFSQPVRIVINGVEAFSKTVVPELGQLLERVREFDDRGRIFHASLPLEVTTDVAVPIPNYL